jgi:predicted dehydrogenase
VGSQGGGLLTGFLHLEGAQCVSTCDPFTDRREAWARTVNEHYAQRDGRGEGRGCAAYRDFRELLARDDIDAVVIATPDHWHVPIALAAIRAGKDVYVEKPLGISMEENKVLRAAVHRYGAVFQYGTQQRSFNTHCAQACELVRNGYVGDLREIRVVAPNGNRGGDPTPQPVPDGLDYELWLGPAPRAAYTHDRVIGEGRYFVYDYSLGFIAGWGAHPLDIAHWGYPHIPVEYEGTGLIPAHGLFDTVVDWQVTGRYESGVLFTLEAGPDSTTFVGTEGQVTASRAGISATPESLLRVRVGPDQVRLLQDTHHHRDFVTCVRDRTTPVSDIDSAVQSDFISHLSDMAIRTGRRVVWDPVSETVVGDEELRRMMTRPLRPPWRL